MERRRAPRQRTALTPAAWLVNGNDIVGAEELASTTEGELLLEDMNPPLGEPPDILCSGRFIGVLLSEGRDLITLVEGLAGEDNILKCVYDVKGACSGTTVNVEARNLPWETELMLTAGGLFVDLIFKAAGGEPGYLVECSTIIGKLTDECLGEKGKEVGSAMTNVEGGAEGEFSETDEEVTPSGECSLGGAKQGLLFGKGLVTSPGGTVTVSEP
jgi:hypothetical protein